MSPYTKISGAPVSEKQADSSSLMTEFLYSIQYLKLNYNVNIGIMLNDQKLRPIDRSTPQEEIVKLFTAYDKIKLVFFGSDVFCVALLRCFPNNSGFLKTSRYEYNVTGVSVDKTRGYRILIDATKKLTDKLNNIIAEGIDYFTPYYTAETLTLHYLVAETINHNHVTEHPYCIFEYLHREEKLTMAEKHGLNLHVNMWQNDETGKDYSELIIGFKSNADFKAFKEFIEPIIDNPNRPYKISEGSSKFRYTKDYYWLIKKADSYFTVYDHQDEDALVSPTDHLHLNFWTAFKELYLKAQN